MKTIDAGELRIGNWIFEEGQDDNKPFQIFSIYHEVKNNKVNGLPICLMRPIPLTEDILLKCGFECYEFDNGEPNQYRFKNRLIVIRKGNFVDYGCDVIITSLHQLQNLYFALTGQELQINFDM
jgi:hypothetical protein